MTRSIGHTVIKSSISLALAASCCTVLAAPTDTSKLTRAFAVLELQGMKLGVWERYSRNYILPDFSSRLGMALAHNSNEQGDYEVLLSPYFSKLWELQNDAKIKIDFDHNSNNDLLLGSDPSTRWFEADRSAISFDRTFFAPGVSRRFGRDSSVDVSAVFAVQSYATQGLGYSIDDPLLAQQSQSQIQESSAGTGIRVAFNNQLSSGIQLGAQYQSRIDMDAFQEFRGVYSEPGDFDIPASANFGLAVKTGKASALNLGVERVLYSEVNTFTSNGLPDRFLSLLGDSGSPNFAWQDLTVYRVGWEWAGNQSVNWRLDYSTREQPIPTSPILANALTSEVADRSVRLGVSKDFYQQTGVNARFDFAVSYAPSEYFLGTTNRGRQADFSDDQFEFELRLVWDF